MIGALVRGPGADLDRHPGPAEVDRRAAPKSMPVPVGRQVLFVGAPAQLGGLAPLAQEALHRPGIGELHPLLARLGHLGVALGAVDHLDPELHGQAAPLLPGLRDVHLAPHIAGHVDQALFDPVRDEPRVGPIRDRSRGRLRVLALQVEDLLSQGVVGPGGRLDRGVDVPARPRLDAGVEVEGIPRQAELDEVPARDIHREVEQEVPGPHQRLEDCPVVVRLQGLDGEPHPILIRYPPAVIIRGEDQDVLPW